MGYYNLILPRNDAWEIMNELGEIAALEFIDQNVSEASFNRPYSGYIKRCEEMENKIKTIETEMGKFGKSVTRCEDPKQFLTGLKIFMNKRNKAGHTYFEELEGELDDKLKRLNDQIKTYDKLVEKYNHLIEFKQVLLKTRPHLGNRDFKAKNVAQEYRDGAQIKQRDDEDIDHVSSRDIKFNYLAGVINKEDSLRFKRMLFRVTRGMVWTVLEDIEQAEDQSQDQVEGSGPADRKDSNTMIDSSSAKTKPKTVFLVVYQGGGMEQLKTRLNRICDSFGASKYGIPEDRANFDKKVDEVNAQLTDTRNVINITKNHINMLLKSFTDPRDGEMGDISYLEEIRLYVLKEKSIYHNLNSLKLQDQLYYGAVWCPLELEEKVRAKIQDLQKNKHHIVGIDFTSNSRPPHQMPPTYFRTNEFTAVFQEIVNTYGIPRYREVNPGLYTIATFPFLFGVMFGDIGHGGLLFAFGIYLCLKADEIKASKSLLALLHPARYLLLLMGMFAFYCGFIYNDFMSIPFNLFGSCYNMATAGVNGAAQAPDCIYPFGLDPAWYGTSNELTFFNSYKMKLSVILGVSQMTMGIFLKSINAIHFGQPLDFFFEFLPQITFMFCTFVYMDVMIVIKWLTPWGTAAYNTANAPSIITLLINMPLKGGSTEGKNLYGVGLEQQHVQLILLVIALICVPLMLLPKPLILLCKNKMSGKSNAHHDEDIKQPLMPKEEEHKDEEVHTIPANKFEVETPNPDPKTVPEKKKNTSAAQGGAHLHGEEFEFGEIFVHQVIETIEFVLGSISNTASYLRLWALSLAHGQLATVFFENTIGAAIISGSIVTAFIGFFIFANVTFGVLMCMDLMECGLHALRLHWVEFQNKFYKADGHKFLPFSFEDALMAPPKQ
jgi:V-type H+-transporting ATPase subunit a